MISPTTRALPSSAIVAFRICSSLLIMSFFLDNAMLIVAIEAYTNSRKESSRPATIDTSLTFTAAGHDVQRTEIALAVIGIALKPTLVYLIRNRVTRLPEGFRDLQLKNAGHVGRLYLLPGFVITLVAWVICIGLQARYVPILNSTGIPECGGLGNKPTQCKLVSATWIMAIVYCSLHLVLFICSGIVLYGLWRPDEIFPLYTLTVDQRGGPRGMSANPELNQAHEPEEETIGSPSKIE